MRPAGTGAGEGRGLRISSAWPDERVARRKTGARLPGRLPEDVAVDEPPQGLPGHRVDAGEAHAWLAHRYAGGARPMPALPSEVLIDQLERFTRGDRPRAGAAGRDRPAEPDRAAHRRGACRPDGRRGLPLAPRPRRFGPSSSRTTSAAAHNRALTDVAFVGHRLLRWCPLTASSEEAAGLLKTGASGYPRNAFVCDADSDALELEVGRTLDVDAVARLRRTRKR